MNHAAISQLAFALAVSLPACASEQVHSLNSPTIVGRYTDELPKSSEVGRFTQPLISDPKLALEYRVEGKQDYVMLLERAGGRSKILDVLKIPAHSAKESVSFSCAIAGGSKPDAGGGAVGLVTEVKQSQTVTAKRGWDANLQRKKLEPVEGKKTLCDLRGVD